MLTAAAIVGLSGGRRGQSQLQLLQFYDPWGAVALSADPDCATPALANVSRVPARLFCYAVVTPGSYEVELLQYQMQHRAGIFGCDSFVVFSNVSELGLGLPVRSVIEGPMDVHHNAFKQFRGDALNTPIFMPVWTWLAANNVSEGFDWTVKLDADSVFYAPLLRHVTAGPLPVSFPSCRRAARSDPLALTYWQDWLPGPIEAINAAGMRLILSRLSRCVARFPPGDYGEDIWMQRCRAEAVNATEQVSCVPLGARLLQWEGVTPVGNIFDKNVQCDLPRGPSAALHAFKSLDEQRTCLAAMVRAAATDYLADDPEVVADHMGLLATDVVAHSMRTPVPCGHVWCQGSVERTGSRSV